MKHFEPKSPDPFIKNNADQTVAKFGHINYLVDKFNEFDANQSIIANPGGGQSAATSLILGLNEVSTAVNGDSAILPCLGYICKCNGGCGPIGPVVIKNVGPGSLTVFPCVGESIDGGPINAPVTVLAGQSLFLSDTDCTNWATYGNTSLVPPGAVSSVTGCLVDNTDPANPIINDINVAPVSPTEALTGDGCNTPLSVCIDNVTIVKEPASGCLMVVPSPPPPPAVASVTGCNVDNTDPLNPVIDPINVAPVSATEAITGDGCTTPLSVCIDNTTITKDANGCLQAVPQAASVGYAEFVEHIAQAPIAPGTAIKYDTAPAPFNTLGIATTTGPGAIGTAFQLPVGVYMVDYENSADAAWSLAIYQGVSNTVLTIDTNTISGASTATTWIHGRAIVQSTVGNDWIMISPVTGTQAIPTAGTAAGEFIARITFLKLA